MGWDGYIPLVNEMGTELLMSQTLPSEVHDFSLTEKRTNKELGRDDLKVIHLLRSETCKPRPNETFQSYLKRSEEHEDQFYYTDIFASGGEALSIRIESLADYLQKGGSITYYPPK